MTLEVPNFRGKNEGSIFENFAKPTQAQLSHATFDPRKMDPKFLEASFEYFIHLSARDDENS